MIGTQRAMKDEDKTKQQLIDELVQARQKIDTLQQLAAEIHRAETPAGEAEAAFRQLAEHSHQVFWLHDSVADRAIYVSPAYETIWGRPVHV